MKYKYFVKMTVLSIIVASSLTACSSNSSTGEYISGAKRRSQKETEMVSGIASTIYTVPEMNLVKVKVDAEYADKKHMDIYYPPNYEFEEKLPAVIIFNGYAGLNAKNMGRHIDWAALIAAHGLIGVTYEPIYPDKDLGILLDRLGNNLQKKIALLSVDSAIHSPSVFMCLYSAPMLCFDLKSRADE